MSLLPGLIDRSRQRIQSTAAIFAANGDVPSQRRAFVTSLAIGIPCAIGSMLTGFQGVSEQQDFAAGGFVLSIVANVVDDVGQKMISDRPPVKQSEQFVDFVFGAF